MSYLSKDLSVLAYANGFTLWHYTTPDTGIEVEGPNYFTPAAALLRAGDMVLANTTTGTSPTGALYRLSATAGGAVTLSKMA